jgi:nucleoside 2-deoxyribosyltransferase
MNVYLAAPYSMKDTIRERAAELRRLGITVTSSWIDEPHKPSTQMHELSHEEHQKYAKQDIDDIVHADIFVFHTDPTGTIVRGGRHVEFGMALMHGIPVLVVGMEYENIFHHCSKVHHFASWTEVVYMLNDLVLMEKLSGN